MSQITMAIAGAGSRGIFGYGAFAERNPDLVKVVAAAEPRDWFSSEIRSRHQISDDNCFSDWRELAAKPKLADAVVIAIPDAQHAEAALAFIEKGYDLLLEKPMAVSEEDCRSIARAAQEKGIVLALAHVLRYTPFFRKVKEIVDSGVLGQIVTVRHMERVGFWHQAHSFTRGNWRSEKSSSPMILAKCCHDLDILLFLLGKRCKRVSSFGRLTHLTAANRPQAAAERCINCSLKESGCPYSSYKFYLDLLRQGIHRWPLDIITQEFTEEAVLRALSAGPYGRCVYACDNDVVDHQVVAMEFEDGISASLTMNAFTFDERRHIEIFGSSGELWGDSQLINVASFETGEVQTIDPSSSGEFSGAGHMGGDDGLMNDFVAAVRESDPALISSGPAVSLESHLMGFAAERSRRNRTVEEILL